MTELNVYAYDIRQGDYLELTRENGRSSAGSSTVLAVTGNDDTVTVTVAAGAYTNDLTLNANEPVTVIR